MFNLTKNISLEPQWKKRYFAARCALYLLFVIFAVIYADRILFPSQNFTLNLSDPKNKSNNIFYQGQLSGSELFAAYSREDFADIKLQLILQKNVRLPQDISASIRKTYAALAYPTAPSSEFPTLNTNAGIPANGSLLSFGNAVFIVVDGKAMPFNNPLTFLSFGYQWKDVVPATDAKMGQLSRGGLFTVNQPHPDGTIFLTQDTHKYFLISDKQKFEIDNPAILENYSKNSPIAAAEKSLDFDISCELQKDLWPRNSYSCKLPTAALAQFPGNDYQFKISGLDKSDILQINTSFIREINIENARNTLSDLKQRVLLRYGIIQQISN